MQALSSISCLNLDIKGMCLTFFQLKFKRGYFLVNQKLVLKLNMATILFLVVALDWFRTEWSLFAIRFYTDFYKFSGVKFSTSGQFPVSEFRIGYFLQFFISSREQYSESELSRTGALNELILFVNNRIVRGSNPHDSYFS